MKPARRKHRKRPAAPRVPSFVEFCDDLGVELTPAQRALAAVAFDGAPIPEDARDLFGGASGAVSAALRRTVALVLGRGSGKTRLSGAYCLWRAITADLSRLAPGEPAFAQIVAPDMALATQNIAFTRGMLRDSVFGGLVSADTATSITITRPDGREVRVQVFAASRGGSALRGKSTLALVLDECAFFRDAASGVVNDRDIYDAVMPRMIEGSQALLISTPWLQSGLLWTLHEANFGKPTTALVAVAPTERMRTDDHDLAARIRERRAADPFAAQREYDCAWLPPGSGGLFDAAALHRAIVPELDAPDPAGFLYMGADLAAVKDPAAFVVVRACPDGTIELVDRVELRPRAGAPIPLVESMRTATELARKHGITLMRADHHVITHARDALRQIKSPLQLDAISEAPEDREFRYQSLAQAFKQGRVRIPRAHAAITDELSRITVAPKPGGGWRYEVSRRDGNHADSAMALLLACEPAFHGSIDGNAIPDLSGDEDARAILWATTIGLGGEQGSELAPVHGVRLGAARFNPATQDHSQANASLLQQLIRSFGVGTFLA